MNAARLPSVRWAGFAVLWGGLWALAASSLWHATLLTLMLVQTGLLVVLGFTLGRAIMRKSPMVVRWARVFRWALLITAVLCFAVWMIPRLLDASVDSAWVMLWRVLSLSFLGGLPLCLSWYAMGPVIRGVLHVEALASVFRFGWLYVDSPVRLCTQYVYSDQRVLGYGLFCVGLLYLSWLAIVALGGWGVKRGG